MTCIFFVLYRLNFGFFNSFIQIFLIKVDAPANQDLANKMEVESFPTIMYFKNGVRRHYTGSHTITSWENTQNP